MSAKIKYLEGEFTDQVLEMAKLFGWRSAHFRPARTAAGWRTPVSGDGKGFPDLVLLRGPVLLIRELKTINGDASPEQIAWGLAFVAAGVDYCIWTTDDWQLIEDTLRR